MCVLCSQTIAFASGPWCCISRSSVSAMCRSRTFHESAPPRDHRAIVGLGVLDGPRVLLGVESSSRPARVLRRAAARTVAADPAPPRPHDVGTTAWRGHTPARLRRTARSSGRRGGGRHGVRVVLLEVADDRVDRIPQRVDVEPVEADLLAVRLAVVVTPQPLGQRDDLAVRPHPGRPALEARAAPPRAVLSPSSPLT